MCKSHVAGRFRGGSCLLQPLDELDDGFLVNVVQRESVDFLSFDGLEKFKKKTERGRIRCRRVGAIVLLFEHVGVEILLYAEG